MKPASTLEIFNDCIIEDKEKAKNIISIFSKPIPAAVDTKTLR